MKNLQLSLKTKWFEMTKAGIKTEDYRDITPYWSRRLYDCWDKETGIVASCGNDCSNCVIGVSSLKKFETNTMTLGYPKSGDTQRILILEHKGIEIRTGNPDWGAEDGKLYFVIKHGSFL
jgi:hypothetical protein